MTAREFYELMRDGRVKKNAPMPPVPIQIGASDEMAAKLLLWLENEMPNATIGDFCDVLDAAKFWHTFWSSAHMAAGASDGNQ